jgi:hypothetical protein
MRHVAAPFIAAGVAAISPYQPAPCSRAHTQYKMAYRMPMRFLFPPEQIPRSCTSFIVRDLSIESWMALWSCTRIFEHGRSAEPIFLTFLSVFRVEFPM